MEYSRFRVKAAALGHSAEHRVQIGALFVGCGAEPSGRRKAVAYVGALIGESQLASLLLPAGN